QLLEIDLDLGRQVLRGGPAVGDASGDGLADVADFARRQHRLLGGLEARKPRIRYDRTHAHEIRRGEHRCLGARGLADRGDAPMRHRAAEEKTLLHAGKANVRDELAATAEVALVLLAGHARADAGTCYLAPLIQYPRPDFRACPRSPERHSTLR